MGCCGSSDGKVPQPRRRRLSVTQVDGKAGNGGGGDVDEEDRGLIRKLNQNTIIEMLQDNNRKFSICSENEDNTKESFAVKTMAHVGDPIDPVSLGLGYTCRKGLKPESPNQDSWSVLRVDGDFSIYAVFDGHGRQGHDVSNYVKENLLKLILRDTRFKENDKAAMLTDSFKRMQSLISANDRTKQLSAAMSGTTATVVLHSHSDDILTIAHVADSTCVLGSYVDKVKQSLVGVALTRDHKPNLKEERMRIEAAGGMVVFDGYLNHRVYVKNGRYPGLNMSRCLGDLLGHAHAGCSCIPEVTDRQVTPLDHVLLVCTDGVWEFMTPQEAVDTVSMYPPDQAMKAADVLAKKAWDAWIVEEGGVVVDDITAVVVYLQEATKKAQEGKVALEQTFDTAEVQTLDANGMPSFCEGLPKPTEAS